MILQVFFKLHFMKIFLFLIGAVFFITSCKQNTLHTQDIPTNEKLIFDTTLSVDTTTILNFKHDPKWFTKDLFDANDESYLLQSVEIFRTRFDSIMKHNSWDIKLGKGILDSKKTHDIFTMPLGKDIKISTRLDKKYHRVTKILLLAEGFDDEHYRLVIKAMKGLILATLNSNYDAEDAELILYQTSLFNDEFYGPGVLQLDGHRYESHKYETTMYFGISR